MLSGTRNHDIRKRSVSSQILSQFILLFWLHTKDQELRRSSDITIYQQYPLGLFCQRDRQIGGNRRFSFIFRYTGYHEDFLFILCHPVFYLGRQFLITFHEPEACYRIINQDRFFLTPEYIPDRLIFPFITDGSETSGIQLLLDLILLFNSILHIREQSEEDEHQCSCHKSALLSLSACIQRIIRCIRNFRLLQHIHNRTAHRIQRYAAIVIHDRTDNIYGILRRICRHT